MGKNLKSVAVLAMVISVVGCQSANIKNYTQLPRPPRDGVETPAFQAPGEPGILAFSDRVYFMLDTELNWIVGETQQKIVIPSGFVSDGASVPKVLWPFGLVPYGPHGRAAIVHDYMYWSQQCSRKQADNIMLIAMKESGVSKLTQWILTAGVRLFGGFAWRENARHRQDEFSRLVSVDSAGAPEFPYPKGSPAEPFAVPIPFSWPDYALFLKNEGARDPVFTTPDYCQCGDSTRIPQENDSHCG